MKYYPIIEPYINNVMSMDIRHAEMIGSFIKTISPFSKFIEVGSCYGISTSFIVTGCEYSKSKCVLIDTNFTDPVLKIYNESRNFLDITLYQESSIDALSKELDSNCLILLDGDHTLNHVQKESNIIKNYMPRSIILHDVCNASQYCEGPKWAFDEWISLGYYGITDCIHRDNERTHRGLAILCREEKDYEHAKLALKLHS